MSLRAELCRKSREYVESGRFIAELREAVAYATVSGSPEGRIALNAYLNDLLVPSLEKLGCVVTRFDSWGGGNNSFVLGSRAEDSRLPTVLCYAHADVVSGQESEWSEGRNPWVLSVEGEHWYGRGTADNKGQHLINLAALHLLLAEKGQLGFNLKFLIECGEEIGSPSLSEFAAAERPRLAADVFIASDGPRLDAGTPTIFLGARGGADFELSVDLRDGGYHSGNWGGVLRNPATTLAGAIGTLVDGHGRIQLPALLPESLPESVRRSLAKVVLQVQPDGPDRDPLWGAPELTAAERVYGWNTVEVLAMNAGDIAAPVNAIPGTARAMLQLRYVVGTPVSGIAQAIQDHLDAHGYGMVQVKLGTVFPASRLDPDDPWVDWATRSVEETVGRAPAVLPNIGGSLPNHVFEDILGLPTLWIPHSYPGCLQHAPNEHLLGSIAVQGLQIACGLFHDLGQGVNLPFAARGNASIV
ncbi:M20 family metallopeptidase [Arthrobacter sp. NPDC090010]|uniref:M20 family metallopeptidase n=1 Tax=Arthrobacter sp. NPDC090010 TaxID=3363942 RepID=UPI0038219112